MNSLFYLRVSKSNLLAEIQTRPACLCRPAIQLAGWNQFEAAPVCNSLCLAFTAALAEISEMVAQLHSSMLKMENFQKLHELKKDLIGIDNLVIPGRVSDRLMLMYFQVVPEGLNCIIFLKV